MTTLEYASVLLACVATGGGLFLAAHLTAIVLYRLNPRPSLARSQAVAALTLVPSARAKVSLRIAPGDDGAAARDALVAHLRAHAPWGAEVTVSAGGAVEPFAARTDGPAYAAARAALAEAWGVPAVEIGVGGSISFVTTMAEAFPAAEILITGVEDPDTRAHGANESLHLGDFERACLAEALLLRNLA